MMEGYGPRDRRNAGGWCGVKSRGKKTLLLMVAMVASMLLVLTWEASPVRVFSKSEPQRKPIRVGATGESYRQMITAYSSEPSLPDKRVTIGRPKQASLPDRLIGRPKQTSLSDRLPVRKEDLGVYRGIGSKSVVGDEESALDEIDRMEREPTTEEIRRMEAKIRYLEAKTMPVKNGRKVIRMPQKDFLRQEREDDNEADETLEEDRDGETISRDRVIRKPKKALGTMKGSEVQNTPAGSDLEASKMLPKRPSLKEGGDFEAEEIPEEEVEEDVETGLGGTNIRSRNVKKTLRTKRVWEDKSLPSEDDLKATRLIFGEASRKVRGNTQADEMMKDDEDSERRIGGASGSNKKIKKTLRTEEESEEESMPVGINTKIKKKLSKDIFRKGRDDIEANGSVEEEEDDESSIRGTIGSNKKVKKTFKSRVETEEGIVPGEGARKASKMRFRENSLMERIGETEAEDILEEAEERDGIIGGTENRLKKTLKRRKTKIGSDKSALEDGEREGTLDDTPSDEFVEEEVEVSARVKNNRLEDVHMIGQEKRMPVETGPRTTRTPSRETSLEERGDRVADIGLGRSKEINIRGKALIGSNKTFGVSLQRKNESDALIEEDMKRADERKAAPGDRPSKEINEDVESEIVKSTGFRGDLLINQDTNLQLNKAVSKESSLKERGGLFQSEEDLQRTKVNVTIAKNMTGSIERLNATLLTKIETETTSEEIGNNVVVSKAAAQDVRPSKAITREAIESREVNSTKLERGYGIISHERNDTAKCDYSVGGWVLDNSRPLYSGLECKMWLAPSFSCHLNKHPDKSYEKYRWQPSGCDLPEFTGSAFLDMFKNKTLGFIGDSLGRQQVQSLICMITRGKNDTLVSDVGLEFGFHTPHRERRPTGYAYRFAETNTTFVIVWTATLARVEPLMKADKNGLRSNALHLDRPVQFLEDHLPQLDVVILNTGHHWNRGKMLENRYEFYNKGVPVDEKDPLNQVYKAMNLTVHSVVSWLDKKIANTDKQALYVALSPRHFRNGDWDTNGTCDSIRFEKDVKVQEGDRIDPIAENAIRGTNVQLLNITSLSLDRGEAHISKYAGGKQRSGPQDCLHWCLPGIPDTWNEIWFAMMSPPIFRTRPLKETPVIFAGPVQ